MSGSLPDDESTDAVVPELVVVTVSDVQLELPSAHPELSLCETEMPFRSLVIPIGLPDGVALAYALRGVETPRPLTHELFAQVLQEVSVDLVAVRLVGRIRGLYFGELDLMAARGWSVVSCRPSDGITLALRQRVAAPVLVDARLFELEGDVPPPGLVRSDAPPTTLGA